MNPPLGQPGGPCHVIRRIRDEVDNQREEDLLVDLVERNKELSNPDASKVYDIDVEQGVGPFKQIIIGPHASYRMDFRSVTVDKLRMAMAAFLKQLNDWKSQKDFEYQDHANMLARGEPIEWFDRKTGLTVIFRSDGPWQVKLITTYYKGKPDPKAKPGTCVVAGYQTDDLAGYQTFVKDPTPSSFPSMPSDEKMGDSEKQQVLPSPPWERSKPSGKNEFNTPPGSEDALDGKSLSIDRQRTLGIPGGDEHPWIDNSTGYHHEGPRSLKGAVKGPTYPYPKQKEQAGVVKRYYQKYYRKHHGQILKKVKRWQRKYQHNPAYAKDKDRRDDSPKRFERQPAGYRQPGERQKEWREEQKEASVRVADRWAEMLYDKQPPQMEPSQRYDRGMKLPTAPRHEHGPDQDLGYVWDNPGSAKVIPEGHDFENKNDRTFKEAARISEILEKTSQDIHDKARSISIKMRRVDAANMMWMFDVPGSEGTYKVRVKAVAQGKVSNLDKMDVQVSCSCPFWKWQGAEHWAQKNGYLYGRPAGTASKPDSKDPNGKHWACKHVVAVLQKVRTFVTPDRSNPKTASLHFLADTLLSGGEVIPELGMSVRVASRYLEGRRF